MEEQLKYSILLLFLLMGDFLNLHIYLKGIPSYRSGRRHFYIKICTSPTVAVHVKALDFIFITNNKLFYIIFCDWEKLSNK